ncbi:MAG: MBL fold metallo-hydrolase [Nitrosopumilaceae archaeon]
MFEYNGLKIRWHGHDTFTLEKGYNICIDPYKLSKPFKADMLLISHNHFDHLSLDDIRKVIFDETIIVTANECLQNLSDITCKKKLSLRPGDEITMNGIKIKAVPAYNINKINPDTQKPFHPKEDEKIGFFIDINGTTIYHTGDSDLIPEMENLQPEILLVPVSGTYVMTPTEAARAVEKIKPKVAIPMHYGTLVGSKSDAIAFKEIVKSCQVQILSKE